MLQLIITFIKSKIETQFNYNNHIQKYSIHGYYAEHLKKKYK